MATYTIERARWARGFPEDIDENLLLRRVQGTNWQHCFGFVASQHGWSDNELQGLETPIDLLEAEGEDPNAPHLSQAQRDYFAMFVAKGQLPGEPDLFTNFGNQVAKVNDDPRWTDEEREQRLSIVFGEYGHTLNFV